MKKRIVVLFSGDGSNFENIVNTLNKKSFGEAQIEIVGAICNRPEANGINRAKMLDIRCEILNHKLFSSREEFDTELVSLIESFDYDLCVLAGFMRILTPIFTSRIRAINIHPSFLPFFKGASGIKESFESEMGFGGVSIHWVSNGVDEGEMILQEKVEIRNNDTFDTFRLRIQSKEHEIYPKAILIALNK